MPSRSETERVRAVVERYTGRRARARCGRTRRTRRRRHGRPPAELSPSADGGAAAVDNAAGRWLQRVRSARRPMTWRQRLRARVRCRLLLFAGTPQHQSRPLVTSSSRASCAYLRVRRAAREQQLAARVLIWPRTVDVWGWRCRRPPCYQIPLVKPRTREPSSRENTLPLALAALEVDLVHVVRLVVLSGKAFLENSSDSFLPGIAGSAQIV